MQKNKYIKRKLLALFMAFAFLMPILSVGATPATRERHRQLEQQLRDARQEVRQQQNLLTGTRHEMSQVMAEMQELDQRMMDVASALEGIELSLLDTEIRIADAEEALEAAREEYDLQFEVLRTRIRVMHENGSVGMIDVLFQARSISDFLIRWEYIRAVAQFDRDLLERIQQVENEIAASIEDLSRWSFLMEDLQFQYQLNMENLEFLISEQAAWFERLAENEELLAELLQIAEYEQRMVESAFGEIQAQLRREENEAARQRAANAAAAHNANLERLNNFDGKFYWPIPASGRITSGFGMRMHPILRTNRMHSGIDVGAPTGTRLYAAAEGYVRFAGWSGGYGNTVIIDHGNGYSTLYAHNSRNRVTTGQFVSRGQHIADVGSTGMSTGPHLHFEVRINNRATDPMAYFRE
ncbi:MAG: peptidoglycan DD-metalloendopeptidase family protein [Defluviitaleaceae bacterium]|nr:peptidoglycan DD-metalloendopeptidase family protein [Defluviitaleaceae bacterium]